MNEQSPYQRFLDKNELINEVTRTIRLQLNGGMDSVRARTYWEVMLPQLPPEHLAEALSYALVSEGQISRSSKHP